MIRRIRLGLALGVVGLSLVTGCAPPEDEAKGTAQSALHAPRALKRVRASSATRERLGIVEWKVYRGKRAVHLTGYDANAQPVKGLSVGFKKGKGRELRLKLNDGTRFGAKFSFAGGLRTSSRTLAPASKDFATLALADLKKMDAAYRKAAARPGAACGKNLATILAKALQCTGAKDVDAATKAKCTAAAKSAAESVAACGPAGGLRTKAKKVDKAVKKTPKNKVKKATPAPVSKKVPKKKSDLVKSKSLGGGAATNRGTGSAAGASSSHAGPQLDDKLDDKPEGKLDDEKLDDQKLDDEKLDEPEIDDIDLDDPDLDDPDLDDPDLDEPDLDDEDPFGDGQSWAGEDDLAPDETDGELGFASEGEGFADEGYSEYGDGDGADFSSEGGAGFAEESSADYGGGEADHGGEAGYSGEE